MRVSWESSSTLPLQTLRVLRLRQRVFAGPLHAHELVELTWIQAGSGLRLVGETVEPFGPGDLVLVAPGAAHTWLSSGTQRGGVRALVLQLRPDAALQLLPEWQHGPGRLLDRPAAAWVLQGELADELRALLQQLEAAEGLQALGLALLVLDRIARQAAQGRAHPSGLRALGARGPVRGGAAAAGTRRRIDALLAWTRRHLGSEIRVHDAAALLHVTPAAFSRAFRRLVGKPYTAYVNDLRIAEACLLLGRGDRPVAEIAAHCGYTTLSHFNAQFRQRTGQTPGAYRALHGNPVGAAAPRPASRRATRSATAGSST